MKSLCASDAYVWEGKTSTLPLSFSAVHPRSHFWVMGSAIVKSASSLQVWTWGIRFRVHPLLSDQPLHSLSLAVFQLKSKGFFWVGTLGQLFLAILFCWWEQFWPFLTRDISPWVVCNSRCRSIWLGGAWVGGSALDGCRIPNLCANLKIKCSILRKPTCGGFWISSSQHILLLLVSDNSPLPMVPETRWGEIINQMGILGRPLP